MFQRTCLGTGVCLRDSCLVRKRCRRHVLPWRLYCRRRQCNRQRLLPGMSQISEAALPVDVDPLTQDPRSCATVELIHISSSIGRSCGNLPGLSRFRALSLQVPESPELVEVTGARLTANVATSVRSQSRSRAEDSCEMEAPPSEPQQCSFSVYRLRIDVFSCA